MCIHFLDLFDEFFSFDAKEGNHRGIHNVEFDWLLRPLYISHLNHFLKLFLELIILLVEEFVPGSVKYLDSFRLRDNRGRHGVDESRIVQSGQLHL